MAQIIFDMDGTIADLFGQVDWLEKLRAYDASPYAYARPLVNMSALARHIHRLQKAGYRVVIVSWLSKESTADYDQQVAKAKREWLSHHLASVQFDEMHFVEYGTPKEDFSTGFDILFDDNADIRADFEKKGANIAFDVDDILGRLRAL